MNLERFRIVTFFIFLTFILGLCFLLIKPFIYILAWSTILTVISYPFYKRILKRVPNSSLCAFLTLLFTVAVIIIPLTFVFACALREGITFFDYFSQSIVDIKLKKITELNRVPLLGSIYKSLEDYIRFFDVNIELIIKDKVELVGAKLIKQSIDLLQNTVTGIIQFFIILLTFYFFLRDLPKLKILLKSLIPLDENQATTLINKVGDTIYTTVYVTIIVAITQGTLGGIAFWFLGLKSPLLWGMVMAVFCLIPLLGHPVVWIPAAILLVLKGLYWKAIILVLWGMFIIGLIDNLIRTVLIGAKTQLHPLLVFFSVLGGVLLIGPLGILLGPVIIVIAFFLEEILRLNLSKDAKTSNN